MPVIGRDLGIGGQRGYGLIGSLFDGVKLPKQFSFGNLVE